MPETARRGKRVPRFWPAMQCLPASRPAHHLPCQDAPVPGGPFCPRSVNNDQISDGDGAEIAFCVGEGMKCA